MGKGTQDVICGYGNIYLLLMSRKPIEKLPTPLLLDVIGVCFFLRIFNGHDN